MRQIKNIIVAIFIAFTQISLAQAFEGKIEMSIKVEALDPNMKSMETMMPTKTVLYLKNNKTRVETNSPSLGNMTILIDTTAHELITLMDMMGQKIAMKTTLDAMNQVQENSAKAPKVKITETTDTKMIAGYLCHRARIETESDAAAIVSDAWFTKEIPNTSQQMPDLKGMPLEFTLANQGFTLTYSTTSIEKQKVDNQLFEIPEGYEVKTMDEMRGGKK